LRRATQDLMARARFSVCTILGLAPSADTHDHRALPVIGRSPAAPARQATALGTPTPSACTERARARANPVAARLRSTSCDSSRATRLHAFLRRLPDYILRLEDTEPESLEIMLRLLVVALPLVVAFPAAFDEQEVNALHFEVQSPLQFKMRSPPESRPHLPAATQDLHKSPATHSTPRAQYAHSAQHPSAPITIHAPRH
jgi:hypothetical protein